MVPEKLLLFALDLFDYKTKYYRTSCVQSKPAHKNTCRDVDQQFPEAQEFESWVLESLGGVIAYVSIFSNLQLHQ